MIEIGVDATHTVSGRLTRPDEAAACLVLAHGAGAGMEHPFMAAVSEGLARRAVATLRYQFPFMEMRAGRPDRPPLAQATVRAAVSAATALVPGLPLFAGGKSFGGRMTSEAAAAAGLPDVLGLVFFGFPLHPAGKPSVARAAHLATVQRPMLFLQGTRDSLATFDLIAPTVAALGARATLLPIEDADHAFHVPKRSGRTDAEVLDEMLDETAAWMIARAG